jgi:hypothetical protein
MSFVAVGGPRQPCYPTPWLSYVKKLKDLYRFRVAVDYAAASASSAQADFGLDVVEETLQTITQHTR